MTRNHYAAKILALILSLAIIMALLPGEKAEAIGSEPYLGQITLFPNYGIAPTGWMKCAGQMLDINTNLELFSLLGPRFGGDGETYFYIPNLKDASPLNSVSYYIATAGLYPSQDVSYGGRLGEIAIFPYTPDPPGWHACDGSTLPTSSNSALYALIGNMFGGDGTNFALPDLQQCAPDSRLQYYISVTGSTPSNYGSGNGDYFYGEINLFPNNSIAEDSSGNCNGQLIGGNLYLYSLLHTSFGGTGQESFALPDLRGAVPDPRLSYFIQLDGLYP